MKHLSVILVLCGILAPICILGQSTSSNTKKMRLVVMDFKAEGVSKSLARKISELIRSEIINTGSFVVIERAQMDSILKEQGFQQTGCTDTECAVKAGKLLSAKKMIVGTIIKLGEKIIINGRLVDVEKGVGEHSGKASAFSESTLDIAIAAFTKKLTDRITGKKKKVIVKKNKPAGKKNEAYLWTTIGFGALSFGSFGTGYYFDMQVAAMNSDYDSLKSEYNSARIASQSSAIHSDMEQKKKDADTYALYRNISYGVGGVAILTAGFFAYKYFTSGNSSTVSQSSYSVMPICYSNYSPIYGSRSKDEYFFGGGLMMRF